MKFLVDAQLPYALCKYLREKGFDAKHTDDMPLRELTSDNEINELSDRENRIVISKDYDFIDTFYLMNKPKKLLWISTGNITNEELIILFEMNLIEIINLFKDLNLIELDNNQIIGYE